MFSGHWCPNYAKRSANLMANQAWPSHRQLAEYWFSIRGSCFVFATCYIGLKPKPDNFKGKLGCLAREKMSPYGNERDCGIRLSRGGLWWLKVTFIEGLIPGLKGSSGVTFYASH
ncbi:hypothetical protein J6590_015541 [Homalodisca vitripennis]|nr:hypothetical protein J6590_015541 [Homalodisca vitripennis]